ncbi:MAG TPA: RHS repeat-associated core domain-containing protein, partial [Armatimonadota bacterium]|nr:RHS repeat-associated core domain-containing protein [Armatimonadota bacterium]
SGYYSDSESGLQKVGARYYDPAVGRWISQDTELVAGSPADSQALNRYAYCEGNPVNVTDPGGRSGYPTGATWAGGSGVLTMVGVVCTAGPSAGTTTTVTSGSALFGLFTWSTTTTTTVTTGIMTVVGGVCFFVAALAAVTYAANRITEWWVMNTSSGNDATTWLSHTLSPKFWSWLN